MASNSSGLMLALLNDFLSRAGSSTHETLQRHVEVARDTRKQFKKAESVGNAAQKQATWIGLER